MFCQRTIEISGSGGGEQRSGSAMLRALVVAFVAAGASGCLPDPPGCARASWKVCPVKWVGVCDPSSGHACTAECRDGYVPVVPPANGTYICSMGRDAGWRLRDARGQLVCERAPAATTAMRDRRLKSL
eukprot:COSAG04_NODE_2405_length_4198_cov_2.319102_2_plen_129_part_00